MPPARLNSGSAYMNVKEVCAALHCAPRTVGKMFDRGVLKGYRGTLSGATSHRKILRSSVINYLEERDLPVPPSFANNGVVLCGCAAKLGEQIRRIAPVTGDVVVEVPGVFQLGTLFAAGCSLLRALVIDTKLGRQAVIDVLNHVVAIDKRPLAVVVLVQDDDPHPDTFARQFDAVVYYGTFAHGETLRAAITNPGANGKCG